MLTNFLQVGGGVQLCMYMHAHVGSRSDFFRPSHNLAVRDVVILVGRGGGEHAEVAPPPPVLLADTVL